MRERVRERVRVKTRERGGEREREKERAQAGPARFSQPLPCSFQSTASVVAGGL